MTLIERLRQYAILVRLHRPIGILLLLWPTLWGLWIAASGRPDPVIVAVFILGTALMRSAGCAINDYADRALDDKVKRTRDRPLAARRIAPWEALVVAAVLSVMALALVVVFLNTMTLYLSFAALLLAASYPYTKRFFAMPQAYLGVAFGFGIPMAFAATTHAVPAIAWWLMLANVFWTIAYDTEYAMVDRDDDIRIGIKSSALLFGRYDVLAVMFCYAMMLGLLAALGWHLGFAWIYFTALVLAAGLAYRHYLMIRSRSREACFKAFLHNNWIGAVISVGLTLQYAAVL